MPKKDSYTKIDVYEGLMGLRHERAMYLGAYRQLDENHAPRALTQTIQEVMSNSIDEFTAGYGKEIVVTIHEDNSVTVKDNGRGMPNGMNDDFEFVYKALTKPHASGKFIGSSYKETGTAGMHGMGLKATNATSKYMTLHATSKSTVPDKNGEPIHDGGLVEYEITVSMEDVVEQKIIRKWSKDEIKQIDEIHYQVLSTNEVITTGTSITYLPDDGPVSEDDDVNVFDSIVFINKDLYPRFQSSAFLNKGLKITYVDERSINEDGNFLTKTWLYENGLQDYIKELSESRTLLSKMKKPISFHEDVTHDSLPYSVQASFIITDEMDEDLRSYANTIPTKDGGPHVLGFKRAFTKAINQYAINNKLINQKGKKSSGEFKESDVFEGFLGVFEVSVPSKLANFEGQTKEKLATVEANPVVHDVVLKHVTDWLYDNQESANQIIEKTLESKSAREMASKARSESRKKRKSDSVTNSLMVSGKYKPCTINDPSKNELFIPEGDSAGNPVRDKTYQAIFPVRGKMLNVHGVSVKDAIKNEEISTLAKVLGTGIGPSFDISGLNFDKIILAADADSDGGHILMLQITIFFKFFRPIIEKGHLYVAVPPLYRATKYVRGNAEHKYYYNEEEMQKERVALLNDKYKIQRFKGLGEMNPNEQGDSVTNPKTRNVYQLSIEDADEVSETLKVLMGSDTNLRKDWVDENVDYDSVD